MHRRFSFESRGDELASALDRVERILEEELLESELVAEMRLVAEEGVTNVIRNAYEEEEGDIEVEVSVSAAEVRLVLRDRGRPFNPLDYPAPDLELPAAERPVGGLGIHIIRSFTDEQTYAREGDENVLVLVKRRRAL